MTHPRGYVLDDELAVQVGLACLDCKSRRVVYAITNPVPPAFPPGAYCYRCLLARCRAAHRIPFPIPLPLLDALKHDLKLDQGRTFFAYESQE